MSSAVDSTLETVETNPDSILGKNPFLLNPVLECLFDYLSVEDIKSFRTVCHQWNSAAETLFRKRLMISFSSSFRPSTFNEYSHIPFEAFKFSDTNNKDGWPISELQTFFEIWGKNIKTIEFWMISLLDSNGEKVGNFNVNTWLDLLPSNLTTLRLKSSFATTIGFAWERLPPVKILTLIDCKLYLDNLYSMQQRIAPVEITLVVDRFIKNNELLRHLCFNDLVDFSNCSTIYISVTWNPSSKKFDLAKDTLNAKKVNFVNISLINWESCCGKIDCLTLNGCKYVTSTKMEIKELHFMDWEINLDLLPQTLEKLVMRGENKYIPENNYRPLCLPNLESFSLSPDVFDPYKVISRFTFCPNLVNLEFDESGFHEFAFHYTHQNDEFKVNVDWIPKSVKNIRMKFHPFNFIGNGPIEVDVLDLDKIEEIEEAKTIVAFIKPKLLVISFSKNMRIGEDVASFVNENRQIEKIVIFLPLPFPKTISNPEIWYCLFRATSLAKMSDEQSEYYEFVNKRGKAITKEQFQSYSLQNFITK